MSLSRQNLLQILCRVSSSSAWTETASKVESVAVSFRIQVKSSHENKTRCMSVAGKPTRGLKDLLNIIDLAPADEVDRRARRSLSKFNIYIGRAMRHDREVEECWSGKRVQ